MDTLLISHYVKKTKVLGPYLRSALWVHGCPFSCPGCLASQMNVREPENVSPDSLADIFSSEDGTEGITISGGEPFMQPGPLAKMLELIKAKRDYGVIIYTGYTIEKLKEKNDPDTEKLLGLTDILIDGNYVKELDDGVPYRGSSNQRILMLSDRYADVFEEYYLKAGKRNIEIDIEAKKVYLVGVPSEHGLKVWRDLTDKARRE